MGKAVPTLAGKTLTGFQSSRKRARRVSVYKHSLLVWFVWTSERIMAVPHTHKVKYKDKSG
jgi:hypothetical protein